MIHIYDYFLLRKKIYLSCLHSLGSILVPLHNQTSRCEFIGVFVHCSVEETRRIEEIFQTASAYRQSRRKIKFGFKMMIGALRKSRNSTSRVSNRSSKIQISSSLIKKSCSKRAKEKENQLTKKAAVKSE